MESFEITFPLDKDKMKKLAEESRYVNPGILEDECKMLDFLIKKIK